MEEWIRSLIRGVGALLSVVGLAGFLFSIGTIQGFLLHVPQSILTQFSSLPETMIGVFVFGIAVGAGSTSAILLGFLKETRSYPARPNSAKREMQRS